MMHPSRIATDHVVEAMVAADTFDLLVQRVRRLVTSGRRMAMAERFATYLNRSPRVVAGLVLDTQVHGSGIWAQADDRRVQCGVTMRTGQHDDPDYESFGFAADVYPYSGNVTEREAWQRYREHEAEHADFFRRRRDMTLVELVGGEESREPSREDKIVVQSWNKDGVCTEKVITFDQGSI